MQSHQDANGEAERSPRFVSLRKLEVILGIPRDRLRGAAARAGRLYAPFVSAKRPQPFTRKQPPKGRTVDNPLPEIKRIQKQIDDRLLKPFTLPEHILGGVKGKTLQHNVELHVGADVLVTIDIRSFFPTVTPRHVYSVWCDVLGFSPSLSKLLTTLTTYSRHLPLGAPTSTSLANLVIAQLDPPIRAACQAAGVRYSSWVDDLAFSGSNAPQVMADVVACLRQAGFAVAHKKIKKMGKGDRKVLTRLVISKNARAQREYVAAIRSGIHHLEVGDVPPEDRQGYIRRLGGCVNYVERLSPKAGEKLRRQLEAAIATVSH